MVALTTEIRESLTGTKTVFLATSSKNSVPNVVPIGAFKLLDDETLLISDQYFHKTLQNMAENPVGALSWGGEGWLPDQRAGDPPQKRRNLPAGCGVDEGSPAPSCTEVRGYHEDCRGLPREARRRCREEDTLN